MAAMTYTDMVTKREAVMRAGLRLAVIIAKPDATDTTTAGVFLVHDPDPGDAPVTTATVQGNAKGGDTGGGSTCWKSFTYANLVTAYGV